MPPNQRVDEFKTSIRYVNNENTRILPSVYLIEVKAVLLAVICNYILLLAVASSPGAVPMLVPSYFHAHTHICISVRGMCSAEHC